MNTNTILILLGGAVVVFLLLQKNKTAGTTSQPIVTVAPNPNSNAVAIDAINQGASLIQSFSDESQGS